MRASLPWRISAIALLAVALGCHVDTSGPWVGDEAWEISSFEVDASAALEVSLEGINGDVLVSAAASTTLVSIMGTRRVRSDSRSDALAFLERVSVEVTQQGGTITVKTNQPIDTGGRQVEVDYRLSVPTALIVRVAGVNGSVSVGGREGALEVSHTNGQLSFQGLLGDVVAALTNGTITGDVSPPAGGLVDLQVVNGDIALDVPTAVSAWLDASVVNGAVSVIGLTVTDAQTTAQSVRGRLGAGDGQIDLTATNGTITLRGR